MRKYLSVADIGSKWEHNIVNDKMECECQSLQGLYGTRGSFEMDVGFLGVEC